MAGAALGEKCGGSSSGSRWEQMANAQAYLGALRRPEGCVSAEAGSFPTHESPHWLAGALGARTLPCSALDQNGNFQSDMWEVVYGALAPPPLGFLA